VTGLVISTWLDLSLTSYAVWRNVHVLASVATLALMVGKIGLHWRWIVGTARRRIFPAPAPAAQTPAVHLMPAATQLRRRDFVRLMAGVGAVALLAGVNVLSGAAGDQTEAASAIQAAEGAAAKVDASAVGTTSTCSVRCGRRCSYPGHCGRYTDANNNGRCDLGECLS
jgi:hypothetical protein